MTQPDPLAPLRNIKVPENMTSSKALKNFLISQVEAGQSQDPVQQIQLFQRALFLLTTSHLEVVHALGVLEESLKALQKLRKESRSS